MGDMTSATAIDLLDNLIGMVDDNQENDYDTAFRMAIDALKAQADGDTISRQAAIAEIARWIGYIDEDMILRIQTGLKKLPPAQPEIVRCKDCRFYQDNNGGYPHMNCKWDANETPDADDFCSGAERKTDG